MLQTGQRIGAYELEQQVGESRMGVIYRARDIRLRRPVALRIVAADLAADPVTRARLNRESTALAALDHPNVPPIYEAAEADGRIFIASRWVEGPNLGELAQEEGPLDPVRAVRIVNQAAYALHASHALGIMHRNVKPSTILVTSADHAYLTDFGLARHDADMTGLTSQDELFESYDYVAPEYIDGRQIDGRVDIYGLGCALYEALTAEVPFPKAGPAAKMYAHLSTAPPSLRAQRPDLPEQLDTVVTRAMAKDPADRQQTPEQFAVEAASAVGLSVPPWAGSDARAAGAPRRRAVDPTLAPAPEPEQARDGHGPSPDADGHGPSPVLPVSPEADGDGHSPVSQVSPDADGDGPLPVSPHADGHRQPVARPGADGARPRSPA
ncbi:MAG TPA: protein kinase, partial [Solirubrobacteraceae bacterium]|nr:protein kinase [Solirubrobacteraceae bacterium]